jgi:hypothetical protein
MTLAVLQIDPINARVPGTRGGLGGVRIFIETLSSFTDGVEVKISNENVFGRTDPIYTYEGTNRKISFSATLNDTTGQQPIAIRQLQQLQYPTYIKEKKRGPILFSPPLVRLRYSPDADDKGTLSTLLFDEIGFLSGVKFGSSNANEVLGALNKRTFIEDPEGRKVQTVILAPDEMTLDFDLAIIHREIAGFDNSLLDGATREDTLLGPKNPSLPFSFD